MRVRREPASTGVLVSRRGACEPARTSERDQAVDDRRTDTVNYGTKGGTPVPLLGRNPPEQSYDFFSEYLRPILCWFEGNPVCLCGSGSTRTSDATPTDSAGPASQQKEQATASNSSNDDIILEGVVEEALPGATFRVKLENEHEIVAYLSGRMRRNRIRVLPADKVQVAVSPYDLSKGRITYRFT